MPDATRSKPWSKKPRNARLTASVGRAVDRVADRAVGERALADAERPHQRLLVADRRLVRVGRDDRHVADRLERLLEREQAARLDAVVVGDQDPRPRRPVAERPGRRGRRARGPPRAAPPATGSPRSLSRSRRSVRARSRVMSGVARPSVLARSPASSGSASLAGTGRPHGASTSAIDARHGLASGSGPAALARLDPCAARSATGPRSRGRAR